MSFGFSVSDITTCSGLALKAYSALKSAREDFEGLTTELMSLKTILDALEDEARSDDTIIKLATPKRKKNLQDLIKNCKEGLRSLEQVVNKYPSLAKSEKSKLIEHIRFAATSKQSPRDKLAVHTASISMFLTSLTHSSLGRLELQLRRALRSSAGGTQVNAFRSVDDDGFYGVWNAIGEDLKHDGVTEQQIVQYQGYVKAYLKELVREGAESCARQNSRRLITTEEEKTQGEARLRGKYEEDRYTAARKAAEEAAMPRVKYGREETRARVKYEEEVKSKHKKETKLRSTEEAKSRSKNEEEAKLGYGEAVKSREKYEKESRESRQRDVRRESLQQQTCDASPQGEADEVQGLIGLLDHMFDLNDSPAAAEAADGEDDSLPLTSPFRPSSYRGRSPEDNTPPFGVIVRELSSSPDPPADTNATTANYSAALRAYTDARSKLKRLIAKGRAAERSRDSWLVNDLRGNAIRDAVTRMRSAGATVLTCDVCEWHIDDRHWHCSICKVDESGEGDYDVCNECYRAGKPCLGKGHSLEERSAVQMSEDGIRRKHAPRLR